MSKMKRHVVSAAKYVGALLMVAVVAPNASAVLYTNVTSNTTLFEDDFEGVSAIGVGFADDDDSTDYDPVATTGTWDIIEDGNRPIQVTDFTGTSSSSDNYPGAFQGDNYMWVNRPTSFFNKAVAIPTSVQDTNNTEVHVEWMAYIHNFSGTGAGIFNMYQNLGASGDRIAGIALVSDGTLSDGSGVTWTANTWQKWEFDYTVGEGNYTLTVDGNSGVSPVHTSGGPAGTIRFSSRATVEYFIDAVPEPATVTVALLGMLSLLSYRRRR